MIAAKGLSKKPGMGKALFSSQALYTKLQTTGKNVPPSLPAVKSLGKNREPYSKFIAV